MKRFTDGTDVTATTALFEYGLLRNPETGKTLVCLNPSEEHTEKNPPVIKVVYITMEEVREALEDVSDGYFELIGSTREEELRALDNAYLTEHISSMDMWNGYFLDQLRYGGY